MEWMVETNRERKPGVHIRKGYNQGKAEVIIASGRNVSKGWSEEYKRRRETQEQKETFGNNGSTETG